jgi:hypothetical protein
MKNINAATTLQIAVGEHEARAALGGISRTCLWKYAKSGVLPSCKLGKRILFPVDGLRAFVERGGTK